MTKGSPTSSNSAENFKQSPENCDFPMDVFHQNKYEDSSLFIYPNPSLVRFHPVDYILPKSFAESMAITGSLMLE
jgi:hypothetical protein